MSGEVTVIRNLDRDKAAVVRITVVVTDTTAPTTQQGKGILYCIHFSSYMSLLLRFVKIPLKKKTGVSIHVCLLSLV
jgi:hypothetical protein